MKTDISKRVTPILLLITTLLAVLMLSGCGSNSYTGFDDSDMPKQANDESVTAKWDEVDVLKVIPRYTGGGLFDTIVEKSDTEVNVYYNLTVEADYLGYNELLRKAGFKLKDGSSLWTSEGTLGVPTYTKRDADVTLVWSSDGTFAICVTKK